MKNEAERYLLCHKGIPIKYHGSKRHTADNLKILITSIKLLVLRSRNKQEI